MLSLSSEETMANHRARYGENVQGDFYVDRTCIDCTKCRQVAPAHFGAHGDGHAFVHAQPRSQEEREAAAAALASCPVSAIGSDGLTPLPAPLRKLMPQLWACGHPSPLTDGCESYLLQRPQGNMLIDIPDFDEDLVRRLEGLGDLRYIFLTHQDTMGDVERFASHFGAEIIVHETEAHGIDWGMLHAFKGTEAFADDISIIHTPGHSEGSSCLLWHLYGGCLFTGDHLVPVADGFTPLRFEGTHNWDEQLRQAHRLLAEEWRHAFPARNTANLPRGYVPLGKKKLGEALQA
jgi:glyoxylase-like metal-dependent hydrolase (beta-lactamase superfamily II)